MEFSKKFAEQIQPLKEKANQDISFRNEFLADPQKILKAHQIDCRDKITVEYYQNYGMYFAIEPFGNSNEPTPKSTDDSFKETHFMDCHQL